MKYGHKEAFCHMQYAGRNGNNSISLSIWNSRDGVTPFITFSKEFGIKIQHVNFQLDRLDPNYKPKKGDLIWASHDQKSATEMAEKAFKFYADELDRLNLMSDEERAKLQYDGRAQLTEMLSNKPEFIKRQIFDTLEAHGEPQPRLILVEEDWK